jgi:hypothetical protein
MTKIAKLINWLMLGVGTLGAAYSFRFLGHEGLPLRLYRSDIWAYLAGAVFPMLANRLALTNRRRSAAVLLLAAAVVLFLEFRQQTLYSGFSGWEDPATVCHIPFLVAGLWWLLSPVLSGSPNSNAIPYFNEIVVGVLSIGIAFIFAFRALPNLVGDCTGRPIFVSQQADDHMLFTAKIVLSNYSEEQRQRLGETPSWSIARVKTTFWGLHWWERRYVLLSGMALREGGEFFLDGYRSYGILERFLPIVTFTHCNRTQRLQDADVDLTILRDGKPKNGGRVLGRATCEGIRTILNKERPRLGVPNVRVLLKGPNGVLTRVTDNHGFYDFGVVSPGKYSLALEHGSSPLLSGEDFERYADVIQSGDIVQWGVFYTPEGFDPEAEFEKIKWRMKNRSSEMWPTQR